MGTLAGIYGKTLPGSISKLNKLQLIRIIESLGYYRYFTGVKSQLIDVI